MTEVTTTAQALDSAPAGAETFYSIHRGLQLQRQRQLVTENSLGHKVVQHPGVTYRFAPLGVLHVEHGQDMLPDGPGGEMQDAVAWLTSHPRLNRRFQWQGHEAGRPLPLETDYMAAVTTATAHGDLKALRTLEAEEESSHQRALLLNTVRHAIEALEASPDVEEPDYSPSLPESYDRQEALEWLASKDVVVGEDATDRQIYDMVLNVVAEEEDAVA